MNRSTGMVRPIANKDVITTKVSGDAESLKQEPFPQSIAAPPAHSLSAALLAANNTDTFSLTDTYEQMCQKIMTDCDMQDGGSQQEAEMHCDHRGHAGGETLQRQGH